MYCEILETAMSSSSLSSGSAGGEQVTEIMHFMRGRFYSTHLKNTS